jgi:hypothetical protein
MESHPADEMIEHLKNAFDGTDFKQTIRDAWDRMTGSSPSAPAPESDAVQQMNKQANDQRVADANKSFVTADAAAKIRAKVGKMGGK